MRTTADERTPAAEAALLERAPFLALLDEYLADVAARGSGRLVLAGGEAGVGKTVLVRAFCDRHRDSARVFSGGCEALFTPRPLGPLADVAEEMGGELAALVERGGKPYVVLAELLHELRRVGQAIVVLEDLHWADEATLDVVRLLGRRVETVPAVVIATFRDDELGQAHPLRRVLGELSSAAAVRRLQLPPLSQEAVAELAGPSGVDPERLFRQTGGNPFFVTEVLAGGSAEIPPTVRDAVLARAGRLGESARSLLEAVAIVPPQAELWLLERLAGDDLPFLDACLESGMLRHEHQLVGFRHELARLAVEESIAPHRRVELHRAAVRALAAPPGGLADLARLAHHAAAAGDAEVVLEYAPAAGARATLVGAHREAAAQYALAVRFAGALAPERRAELLERASYEHYVTEQLEEALEARRGELDCRRELGDRRGEGDALRWLSRLLWCVGRSAEAEAAALGAVELLEQLPPGRELAMAYANVAQLRMIGEDNDEAVASGTMAIELAEQLGDAEILAHALTSVGAAQARLGRPEGIASLQRSVALAREAGADEHIIRALSNLGASALEQRLYAEAERAVRAGLDHLSELDLTSWSGHLLATRAQAELEQGRWDEAAESAGQVLLQPRTLPLARLTALRVVGLVRARRGDPEQWPPLDEARAIAPPDELQQVAPVGVARAEAALLEGRPDAVGGETDEAFALALRHRNRWLLGELAYLRRCAGIDEPVPDGAAEPFALQLAGEPERAAERWAELGCPYEAARALAESDGEEELRRALAEYRRLGARPAAAVLARRLRERHARGPRPSTQRNPADLTAREVEVLVLVAAGLRNADVAARLVVSEKTVDHHVSAILRKLGVRSRAEASVAAVRLGLADPR